MADEPIRKPDLSREQYEHMKVEIYVELQKLVDLCDTGHGDKHLLWSVRQVRHELLKSLSARAGVEYPELLEWLTDQDRTVQVADRARRR